LFIKKPSERIRGLFKEKGTFLLYLYHKKEIPPTELTALSAPNQMRDTLQKTISLACLETSPSLGLLLKASNGVTNASGNNVSQTPPGVKPGMNSLRNQQPTAREILMQTDPQTQKNNVKGHLTRYQERVVQLGEAESRREEVKAQIETLSADPKKNRKELAQLRTENRNLTTQITGLKQKLKFCRLQIKK
jgi:hypothetical protein